MKPTWEVPSGRLYIGDALCCLAELPAESVQTCITSPPYFGLRDYKVTGQIGMERMHDCCGWATGQHCGKCFVCRIVEVMAEVRRVLRADGTLWLNLGDSFNAAGRVGHGSRAGCKQGTVRASAAGVDHGRPSVASLKPKDLIGIPWRTAFALQADGWYLRSDIIWAKTRPMPESVEDRPTRAHEYIFLLSKSERYHYDHDAIKEPSLYPAAPSSPQSSEEPGLFTEAIPSLECVPPPHGQGFTRNAAKSDKQRGHSRRHDGFNDRWDKMTKEEQCSVGRNKRSVWNCNTAAFPGSHYATFPPALIRPCVLAGCPVGGTVLDPFLGSGTTAQVAAEEGRQWIGIDLNGTTVEFTRQRIAGVQTSLRMTDEEVSG